MSTDVYEFFDAAYVMGALSTEDLHAYEAHLHDCAECRTRVDAMRGVLPYLIAGDEADLDLDATPMPDTLLPHLLAQARRTRLRRRTLGIAVGAVAATLLAVTIGLTMRGASSQPSQAMVAVRPSAVTATASVRQTAWGTEITVICGYSHSTGIQTGYRYGLSVRSRAGAVSQLGSWQLNDGRSITFMAGTALPIGQIQAIDITAPDGSPLLELNEPAASQGG